MSTLESLKRRMKLDKSDIVAVVLLGATLGVGAWLNSNLASSHQIIKSIEVKMQDRYPRKDAQKDFNNIRAEVGLPPATLPSTTQPSTQP